MIRRHFLASAALALGLSFAQGAAAETQPVRVGYIADF